MPYLVVASRGRGAKGAVRTFTNEVTRNVVGADSTSEIAYLATKKKKEGSKHHHVSAKKTNRWVMHTAPGRYIFRGHFKPPIGTHLVLRGVLCPTMAPIVRPLAGRCCRYCCPRSPLASLLLASLAGLEASGGAKAGLDGRGGRRSLRQGSPGSHEGCRLYQAARIYVVRQKQARKSMHADGVETMKV